MYLTIKAYPKNRNEQWRQETTKKNGAILKSLTSKKLKLIDYDKKDFFYLFDLFWNWNDKQCTKT
jgi:hypothetical protein